MRKHKRFFAIMMTVLLLLSNMNLTVLAADVAVDDEEEELPVVNISSDWQGSVMGDIGTNDIILDNFEITENEDDTVHMRVSNNRGKIAGNDEGLIYYYKDVDPDANFELSATVHVEQMVVDNNQTAFGLMLRSNVMDGREGGFQGEYVALGGLRQEVRGFYREGTSGYQWPEDLAFGEIVIDEEYELTIRKVGNLFQLTVDGETEVLQDYSGELNYAGLFVARNATVTFSDVSLNVEGQVELGDWEFSAFGDNTNIELRNFDPTFPDENSIRIVADGGKISSNVDGISYYYKEVPVDANFEISTQLEINSMNSSNNQVSFGLMLRDEVGAHGASGGHEANYVSLGALDMNNGDGFKAFYKEFFNPAESTRSLTKVPIETDNPIIGDVYDLSISKAGNSYVVNLNGETRIIEPEDENIFTDSIFAGLYVARGADVTFSNYDITVDTTTVESLEVDSSEMNTEFLVGEALDLTGLVVSAKYSDGTESVISEEDYIVTGFDSSEVGTNTITINFRGSTATIELEIVALNITSLEIQYFPAKTEYFIGDSFDPEGLEVVAEYNEGFTYAVLSSDSFNFAIDGVELDAEFVFNESGTKIVEVSHIDFPDVVTNFEVEVGEALISELEIRTPPAKEQYFLGDELDLSGIVVYAIYDDGSEVRLMSNEFTDSGLDTSTAGDKEVIITHKGIEVVLPLNVKERELETLTITNYPQTTFFIGDAFNKDGLEVSQVYDNGDVDIFSEDNYSVDSSSFDSSAVGTYEIVIKPGINDIDAISYNVTVREEVDHEFDFIRFGQSIGTNRNKWDKYEDGTIYLEATPGANAGKITDDHDGITYYYTELDAAENNFELSADFKVIHYAKTPHDGQESFGIMARDANGAPNDSSVFSSNFAAVGGFSGGTREPNGTQVFARTGVLAPDGEGSQGRTSRMLKEERPSIDNTYPEQTYRLTLAKTNSGFVGTLNDGVNVYEDIIFEPEILNVQDDKMYIGFYVAREAIIEVSNIEFNVTAAATDAPRVYPPSEAVTPNFSILSLEKTPLTEYDLLLRANADGVVSVRQGMDYIAENVEVEAGDIFPVQSSLNANSTTNFSITYLPDDTQYLTSYDRIVRNFTVTNKIFRNGTGNLYVSPEGTSNGTGTYNNELDIDTAIDYVMPGQKIIVKDGYYLRDGALRIRPYNDGRPDAMKYLFAEPGARPVFDFDRRHDGMLHQGDYWHVKGIDFARAGGNRKGYHIGGNHNIVENSRFYENGDSGIQISRLDGANSIEDWPSHNLLLNNVSFDNRDPAENNADGFAIKLTVGEGNVLIGNIAHNNVDDGYDLYAKLGTGPIGTVIFENNIAFDNGTLTDGTVGGGDKNGFKMGGEGIHVPHVIRDSVAWGNGNTGFSNNSNPGLIVTGDNVAIDNNRNLGLSVYSGVTHDFTLDGFISIQTGSGNSDSYPSNLASDTNYLFNGTETVNASGEAPNLEGLAGLETMNTILTLIEEETANGVTNWTNVWDRYFESEYPTPVEVDEVTAQPIVGEDGVATISTNEVYNVAQDGVLIIPDMEVTNFYFSQGQIEILKLRNASLQITKPGLTFNLPFSAFTGDGDSSISIDSVEVDADSLPIATELRSKVYDFTVLENSSKMEFDSENPVVLEFEIVSDVTNVNDLKVFYFNGDEWEERVGGYYEGGIFYYPATHFSMYTVMEVDELEKLRHELQQQIDGLEQQINDLKDTHSSELAALEAALQNLQAAYASLEADNADLLIIITDLMNQLAELQRAFDELAATIDDGDDTPGDDSSDGDDNGDGSTDGDNGSDTNGDDSSDGDTKGDDSSKDDDDAKDSDGDKKSEEDGDELPDTATNMYNFLLIGLALIIAGMAFYLYRGRREKEVV
ncbi:bacterial Ig-like domain-containing protein [Evansella sp. AB-P1]|uniref:bacterial Ig-like domain-containing protein n=1 Tax=Evansella sp. AB-P1 TaxID=3037653 RepID=UPI00241DE35E|nr:bacterial Ig-like domain-containing protein [Evansella sp. AB-P1]MDG5787246.1 bacterial Ig-like domain-containing protein [Evansella sp. AB-P1]